MPVAKCQQRTNSRFCGSGGQFEDVQDLVAGVRGRLVFDEDDLDAGISTVGTVMGLIDDIPTCEELIRGS